MKKKKQVLLTLMKISLMQLVLATMMFSVSFARDGKAQDVLNRKISLNIQDQSIKNVLRTVEKKTSAHFVYSSHLIQAERKVSISVSNESLEKVLTQLLQPLNLTYEASGETIILSRNYTPTPPKTTGKTNLQMYNAAIPTVVITGKVTDESGVAIPGVSVRLKEIANLGTSTDAEGKFTLNIPELKGTLVVSSVGFVTQEMPINNQSNFNIILAADTKQLGEVVVVGYGTQKKADLTGAVSVINVDQMAQQPTTNLSNQLQGRASGVTVLGSGQPGEAPQIRIRGINTFGNNTPLYVIDGVPTQNINDINTNDIASIQVLKDAGSASIYGSRAANGVVIMTTKRGKGKVKVSYDGWFGVQVPKSGNVWNILNPQEMANLKWQALSNSGSALVDDQYGSGSTPVLPDYIVPTGASEGSDEVDPSLYYVNPNYTSTTDLASFYRIVKANKTGTDWYHEIFKPATTQSHNISVSGGGETGSYFFSLNHTDQQGTLINTYMKRYTLRTNSSYNVTDKIRVGENLAVSVVSNPQITNLSEGNAIGMAFREQPIIPVYDIMGNYAGSYGSGLGNAANPVANQQRTSNNKAVTSRIFGNIFAEFDFLKDFSFRTSFGGEYRSLSSHSFTYPQYENAENTTTNSYTEGAETLYNYTWTNTLNYHHTFNTIHDIKVLLGTEAYYNSDRTVGGTTTDYFSFDPDYTTLSTGSGTQTNYSTAARDALSSYIGRIDYNLLDKYIISATLRRDGSSKFLTQQFGWFPAVSAGWRISKETFMKNIDWITDLKIRGGYGVMGNQLNVDAANAYTTYGSSRYYSYYGITGADATTTSGLYRTRIGNPDAKWERNINSNIGVDASLFNGKYDVTVDFYRKEIKDLLYNTTLAGTYGLGTVPYVNIARMRNQGIDLALSGNWDLKKDLKLNATLTFTSYNNKILNLTSGITYFDTDARRFSGSYIVRNQVGHSMSQFYGYKIVGFWNTQSEIDEADAAAQTSSGDASTTYQNAAGVGRFRYADTNGDGIVSADDKQFLGNPNPKFSYGINLGLTYKNFDFSIFLYGTYGNDIWNNVKWWTDFYGNFQGAKSKTALYDSWTSENHNAKAPIQEVSGYTSTTDVPNSYYVEKGSYLRAKNAQIGYTLPASSLSKIGVSRLRVYLQSANLFTITKYSGLDPEVTGGTTSFGIDEGTYPNQRQYLIGLNLTF
ncbi:MAG: TonB-dependent receptor [Siphonobacter sp.]